MAVVNPTKNAFNWPIRVYWEDTDAGQIVYHARYLHFMERARSEWLRHIGIEQDQLRQQQNLVFVVTQSQINWLKPARYDDELSVSVENVSIGRASLKFEQKIWRSMSDEPELLVTASVRAAAVNAENMTPERIPQAVHQQFVAGAEALLAQQEAV